MALIFLCKGENYACQRSDKSGYSGCSRPSAGSKRTTSA
nr:MAG TPA: hypothetical protein [Caudoviricetes sp.]